MDVRVRERLVGALVLVAIVVMLVPAVLTGPERAVDAQPAVPTRSVEVLLEDSAGPANDEDLVPEPAAPAARPAPPAQPPTQADVPRDGGDRSAGASQPSPLPSPAPPAAAAVPSSAWAVQLGAFSARDKAERLVADLRKRGYAAFVLEYRANGQVLHRVRVGPEQDRERAAAIADRLRKDGFQPVVAPHP
jgi:DedD protein